MDFYSIKTDDTLRETIAHGRPSYPFAYYLEDIWQFDFHCIDWHWHHEVELLSMRQGAARCLIGPEQLDLPQGWGLFVNSGVLHRFEAQDTTLVPNVVFSPALLAPEGSLIYEQYIRPVIEAAPAFQLLCPQVAWQRQILALLEQVYQLQETGTGTELATVSALMQLWQLLACHLEQSAVANPPQRPSHSQARLQIMMQYIHDHYREPVTLEEIAAAASISKSRALQLFQAGIHVPPVAYLIHYRLMRAAELLYTTRKPVAAVAAETGFTSPGYFCRKFKERYQVTPNEYRKSRMA